MSARKNVEAGARLLDEELGTDWVLDIDLETLDIDSCVRCVLGQLFRTFGEGLRALADDSPSENWWSMELDGPTYGFDFGYSVLEGVTPDELNTLWVDVIWERLKEFAA